MLENKEWRKQVCLIFKILHSCLEKEWRLEGCFRSFFSWSPTMSNTHPISGKIGEIREEQLWRRFRIFCTFLELRSKRKSFQLSSPGNLTWLSGMSLWFSFWGADVETGTSANIFSFLEKQAYNVFNGSDTTAGRVY